MAYFTRLPFNPDESPLSFAARLGAFESRQRVFQFIRDLGFTLADLNHGRACAIDRLCEVTGEEPSAMWRNTAWSDGRLNFTLRGEPMPSTMLLREETRFCPLCLAEDDRMGLPAAVGRRGRLIWSLRIVTTCPDHHLPLHSRKRDVWDDMAHELSVLVPESTDELRRLADHLEPRASSGLQDYVVGRLEGTAGPTWLGDQTLEQVIKASEILGVTMLRGPSTRLGLVDRDGWEAAGREGWKWMARGPEGVREALHHLQDAAFRKQKGGQSYAAVFGRLYTWLAMRGQRSDHGPVKELVRDYIIQNLDVTVGTLLLGKPVLRRQKHSVRSLATETGMNVYTLRNLLVARGDIPRSHSDMSCSILLVDPQAGRQAVAALKDSLELAAVAEELAANRAIVSCLLDSERLVPLHRGSGRSGRISCKVAREHVDALLQELHDIVPEQEKIPDTWVPMTGATKRGRLTMQSLVDLIFTRKLRSIARPVESVGFVPLRIDPAEIKMLSSR